MSIRDIVARTSLQAYRYLLAHPDRLTDCQPGDLVWLKNLYEAVSLARRDVEERPIYSDELARLNAIQAVCAGNRRARAA